MIVMDYTLLDKKIPQSILIQIINKQSNKQAEGNLFLTAECQLINIKGMVDLGNHHCMLKLLSESFMRKGIFT